MRMDRVHSLGDSWTCIEAGGVKRGWEVYAGLEPAHRHGIPGSTAAQWAETGSKILAAALATMEPGDIVFVSLSGNDFRHAITDGVLTPDEITDADGFLACVIRSLREAGMRVIVMGYANPWPANDAAASVAFRLCGFIRRVANENGAKYFDTARHLVMPAHFDGADFHPTAAGHQALADAIKMEVNG